MSAAPSLFRPSATSKIRRRCALGMIFASPALIAGCRGKETLTLYQRHDLLLHTPDGPAQASSVIEVTFKFYPGGLPMTNTYVTASFKGQMPFFVLKEGPLWASMFPATEAMVRLLADHYMPGALDHRRSKAFFDVLPGLTGGPALDLPKASWPKMVVFHDKTDPLSVAPLDPGRVAETFGPGYGVRGYQLSFVAKAPLERRLLEEMPWLGTTGSQPIDGRAQPDVGKNKLASRIYASQFVRPIGK